MAEMVYITELDTGTRVALPLPPESVKIGRASCRERVYWLV